MTLYRETSGSFAPWAGEAISGIRHPLTIEQHWSAAELAAIGLYAPPAADPVPADKISNGEAVQRVDGVVKWVHLLANKPQPTLAQRREELIPRVEQTRWEKEIGGMTFNGVTIPTDDRAKTLIMGARTAAIEQGEAYADEWKVAPGQYVPLNAAAAIGLGDALLAHIRACFAREKVLIASIIDANTHAAMDAAEADIGAGWPA